tara:strand:- start:9952 stop:11151 length:1200 start_codon:yes stop_codon:yes gene_type:complete
MKMVNGLIEMDNMDIGNGITEMVDEYYGNTSQEFRQVMSVVLTANSVMKNVTATRLSDLSSDEKVAHEVLIEAMDSDSNALKVSKSFETWYESDDCDFDEFVSRMEQVELVEPEDEPEIEDEPEVDEPSTDLSVDADDRIDDVEQQLGLLENKMDSILDAIEGLKSSKPSLPSKSNAKTATKTTTKKVAKQPATSDELITTKSPRTPKGWKNGQHSVVAIITDQVNEKTDGSQHTCKTFRGMNVDEATQKARGAVLRRILQTTAPDINKLMNKTELANRGIGWTDLCNEPSLMVEIGELGITTDVLDNFCTGANKYENQLNGDNRTASKLRTRLGVTNTATFIDAVNDALGGDVQPSKKQSKTPAPSNNEVATIDPAQLQQLVDGGMAVTDALAFLNNN